MRRLLVPLLAALACGFALVSAGSTRADIIVTLDSITPAAGGGYIWSYSAQPITGQVVTDGNFFTIYDFWGYTSFGTAPTGWTGSSNPTGRNAHDVLGGELKPTDSPDLPNVTFTYHPTTLGTTIDTGVTVSGFQVKSDYGQQQLGIYAAEGTGSDTSQWPGQPVGHVSATGVGKPVVPEPSSVAVLLPMLAPLGMVLRRRR